MFPNVLLELATETFHDTIGFVPPPSPLRRLLHRAPNVQRLATSLRYGSVTETEIRSFVGALLPEFRPGEYYRHDLTFAAVAVAMEHWESQFAEEFLHDLARLQRTELIVSIRVARECLKARCTLPKNEVRVFHYSTPAAAPAVAGLGIRVAGSAICSDDRLSIGSNIKYVEAPRCQG